MPLHDFRTLPYRRFVDPDAELALDEQGFLAADSNAMTDLVHELFGFQAVLIIAPPWGGKTFVAKQLRNHFRENKTVLTSEAPFGQYFHATLFEEQAAGGLVLPDWWDEWQRVDTPACWIVDAIDEDARSEQNQIHAILDAVERLHKRQWARLSLLIFSRENEVPPKVEERLEAIYRDPSGKLSSPYVVRRLAPPDADTAMGIAGGREAFERV
ncbi:MAG: hypothetical protein ACYTG0_46385, partial [Planctomycetota bacterium]